MRPLIILNPSTLTFLLDRLSSNLFKMIKVGIIITKRNVIIAFLSFALGAPPPQQDRYLARRPYCRIFLGPHYSWAWPATAGPSNLRRTSASATTGLRSIAGFGDTVAVFRACCGRSRIQAEVCSGVGAWRVSTRVAPLAPLALYWRPAPSILRRSVVPSMSASAARRWECRGRKAHPRGVRSTSLTGTPTSSSLNSRLARYSRAQAV
jgi:hypothetical protein